MNLLLRAGTCVASFVGWETLHAWETPDGWASFVGWETLDGWESLCYDVKQLILVRLSFSRSRTRGNHLQGVARGVSQPDRRRAVKVVAVGEETFGKDLVSTYVTALQRPMHGFSNNPDLLSERKGAGTYFDYAKCMYITNTGNFTYATWKDSHGGFTSDGRCGTHSQILFRP
jgi:hypothetical protein